jgi:hypothetical protein
MGDDPNMRQHSPIEKGEHPSMSEIAIHGGQLLQLADQTEHDDTTHPADLCRHAGERWEDLADRGGCLDCGHTMTELASGDVVCTPCGTSWDNWDDYLREIERLAG